MRVVSSYHHLYRTLSPLMKRSYFMAQTADNELVQFRPFYQIVKYRFDSVFV